ncbi:MAG: tetratricopeptide repeat protein [Campylobacterales bacterium]|nr:tetratricopeptide repeat protein [Campylobacterales bacterium]
MAEPQEEIIIIEESDAAGVTRSSSPQPEAPEAHMQRKKRYLIMGGAALLILSLASGVTVFLFSHQGAGPTLTQSESIPLPRTEKTVIEPSELEKMIDKANYLYANGNQTEALKLYEKIALYSEAVSQYNLGVVRLKEGEYDEALENFKRSIASDENRCVSAINAAVCSLHLKREKDFNYYIDLAAAYLPRETNSPLFSYYYSLIHYYKGNYLEALSALKNPQTREYLGTQNRLRAKIGAMYGSYSDAIHALENPLQEEDSFTLGLLYANTGDLASAKKYLSDAILQNSKPIEEKLALAFVLMKAGEHENASKLIKETTEAYPGQVYAPYPVRVFLKPSLFNPDAVQNDYRSTNSTTPFKTYQSIFYFAPYKIFNAAQTISYIRKGTANIYIDDVAGAKEYLQKSTNISNIDYGIALAIQKALNFRLRDANRQLAALVVNNPKHSNLHYNLGLTYAQLGDYPKAYEHFLRSYHLDANNYLSGIFAMMSSNMSGAANAKLASIIKENLSKEPETEEYELYRTLVDITNNNFQSAAKWLDKNYKERPLYLALNVLIGLEAKQDEEAKKGSEKLVRLQPHDLLPHLMYIDSHFKKQKPKAFAASAINYLKKQPFTYDDLYFGPQITRERLIKMSVMTGQLASTIQRLQNKLQTTGDNTADINSALAQAYLYNRNFEEAYTLYNQVIDTHNIKDEQTLFLGACASIGAEHYQNAIALLELSKLKNPDFKETRYALALLYLQIQNNPASATLLARLGNEGFVSRYFDFAIDTDKLASDPKNHHPL